jgi:hypothetical protein
MSFLTARTSLAVKKAVSECQATPALRAGVRVELFEGLLGQVVQPCHALCPSTFAAVVAHAMLAWHQSAVTPTFVELDLAVGVGIHRLETLVDDLRVHVGAQSSAEFLCVEYIVLVKIEIPAKISHIRTRASVHQSPQVM